MKLLVATLSILAWTGGLVLAKEVTTGIKVKGMTCGGCAVSVKEGLTRTKGVKSAEVSLEKCLVTVVFDDTQVTEGQIREAINKTGFEAVPAPTPKQAPR